MNFADGLLNRSAATKAVNEAKYGTLLARVRMTMDLMRDHHCRMPDRIPNGEEYASAALSCRTAMLEAEVARSTTLPAACNDSSWVAERH
jgi:hypothetical protein